MKILFAGPDDQITMRTSGDDRKKGLHLSDITKRMAFEKDKKLNPENPIDAMVLERGFTWEYVLESALNKRHERPGYRPPQMQEEGIWMSPDWLNPDGDIQLEEWKATKKSLRQVTEQGFGHIAWTWLYNSMSYLRSLLRAELVKTKAVRFRVWFMNGDYSYESKTSDYHLLNDYWRFDVAFDRRELEENWNAILSAGRRYGLLKGSSEETCRKTATPKTRKPDSVAPRASQGPARVVMFRRSKGRSTSSDD